MAILAAIDTLPILRPGLQWNRPSDALGERHMDEHVLAAMARWPNVPDVYGWLSLSRRGIWHLHPGGRATDPADPGEPITSPQITAFIGRNYAADARGRWFFQNGPQRVYVRLDAAPWILRTDPARSGAPDLVTHTGQAYGPVTHWWLDADGCLYAQAAQGAGLIDGRDLPPLLAQLHTPQGPLLDALDPETGRAAARILVRQPTRDGPREAPLEPLESNQAPQRLGFTPNPQPDAKISA
jgi:hypothetical protein